MRFQTLFTFIALLLCGSLAQAQDKEPSQWAHEYYEQAGKAMIETDRLGREMTPAERADLVERNAAALALLRQGLAYDFHSPVLSLEEMFQSHSQWRALSRLLAADGEVKAARGDWNAATGSYTDAVKLGVEVTRGGMLMDLLSGQAMQAIGRRKLEESLTDLNDSAAQQAARRLEIAVSPQPAFVNTLRTEFSYNVQGLEKMFEYAKMYATEPQFQDEAKRHFRELQAQTVAAIDQPDAFHAQAARLNRVLPPEFHVKAAQLNQKLDELQEIEVDEELPDELQELEVPEELNAILKEYTPEYFAQLNFNFLLPIIAQGHFSDRISRTKNQFLLAALALQAYRVAHGEYPETLVHLVPAYLEKAPSDVFVVNETLRYKRDGAKYLLYSVGPDGLDDDGSPIHNPDKTGRQEYSVRLAGAEARGDIVFGVNN